MKRSTDRILTTHTGSLARPPDLVPLIREIELGQTAASEAFNRRVREAVAEVVRKQLEVGLDIVNDGELGKPGYSTYMKDRLTGFEGENRSPMAQREAEDFPAWGAARARGAQLQILRPACNGPIAWKDFEAVRRDIDNLTAAVSGREAPEVFMTAASPGVIANFMPNDYYPTQEQYLETLAGVMRDEYNAIHAAGFLLQIDCPDLAMARHLRFPDSSLDDFRKTIRLHVELLNEATKDIPADAMRIHLCWGNYEGPHHLDVALADIIDIVLASRPAAISFEGANPRHEHEWRLWKDVKLPAGRVLVPGVIDSTTNFIEHPRLVADRILRYAELVGRENVIASVDCGFGTFATMTVVDPGIAWAKLQSLAEGAAIASKELW